MSSIANNIRKIARLIRQRKQANKDDEYREYQKITPIIEEFWKAPEGFLQAFYDRLLRVHKGKMTHAQLKRALKFFQDSQSLVKPKGAEKFFYLLGDLDWVSTSQDVKENQFIKELKNKLDLSQYPELQPLFTRYPKNL
jgi:hypothetical protein